MSNFAETIKVVQRSLGGLTIDGIAGPKTWDAIENFVVGHGKEHEQDAGKADPRSEENIATLQPLLQPIAREFLQHVNAHFAGLQNNTVVKIICGTRTDEEQNALYAKGRNGNPGPIVTNAPAGYSNHNFGLAFDFGLFDERGNFLSDSPLYEVAGDIGKSLGLVWGGDWVSIVDRPHLEFRPAWSVGMSESETLAELRARQSTGEALA